MLAQKDIIVSSWLLFIYLFIYFIIVLQRDKEYFSDTKDMKFSHALF